MVAFVPRVSIGRLLVRLGVALVLVTAVVVFLSDHGSLAGTRVETGPLSRLTIETATGVYPFDVEVADTDASRERGLMYRRSMPGDRGMLFDMGVTRETAFWMHNTYIPLDIIFIAADGRVVSIAANAHPQSDKLIRSGAPVRFVLELNARQAARMDLAVGDHVRHSLIDAIAR